ncbi:hypothetical protein KR044_002674 [Drosophila immigrans]|nr:hypothetical protein KR044_002674 [Drosophila immigrans]
MVTGPNDLEYKMDHKYRGLALIFSHEHFEDANLMRRTETDTDTKNLMEALQKLDFTLRPYKDLRLKEVRKKIMKAAALNHSEHDCILVAVLSHGENDFVYARDACYRSEDLWNEFTADKCPTLAGKPKLFIVQGSQGQRPMARQTQTDSDSNSSYRIPIYADFLVAFSTIPIYGACGQSSNGSWFIYNLCQELLASGRQLDLLTLLTFVAQRVAVDFETCDEGYKPAACTMSSLTRIVHFADRKVATSP